MINLSQKEPIIVLNNVYKIYKRGEIDVVALKNISCSFYPGEISLIMGPSGSGKSTLLNLIAGIDKLNSGQIISNGTNIENLEIKELDQYREENIGFVFQFNNLIPQLTALENIEIAMKVRNEKESISLLSKFQLESRKHHYPSELSGGEQQKIAILIALASDPTILILDEPTGELDALSKEKIGIFLQDLIKIHPDKSFIIVTHDSNLVKIADKLFILEDGVIEQASTKFSNDSKDSSKQSDLNYKEILNKQQALKKINHLRNKIKEFEDEVNTIESIIKD